MTDVLQTGMSWLASQMKGSASQTVTYVRGAKSVTVQATLGHSLLKLTDHDDQRIERTDADFLISVADLAAAFLKLNIAFGSPARGDEVRVTFGSTVNRYQVLAVGNEPPWRFSDSYHNTYRIHAKYIGNV